MSRNLIPEYVVRKVGGRFRLSSLLQKRMQQLNRGAPRLVDIETDDPMKIALAELMADKVALAEGTGEVVVLGQTSAETFEAAEADEEAGGIDLGADFDEESDE